ncbi:YraN family protein [Paracrocinitomix mangrovi]|uniref:YraN family protein n=1 Tax=Paracrocinitomix mangrovi TaxID=2862509 RepID=UPI001C8DFC9D|nr:YraN family protein [Paracrocinitomix mangrovi]UKN00694.1 YraN family protein [Paracrocinitomix mangrovi]
MADHNDLGVAGEELAVDFLVNKGHTILSRNYRFQKMEIDIISEWGNMLVVTEVKTRQSSYLTDPNEILSLSKQRFLIKAADQYIKENEIDKDCRFDLVIIVLNEKQKEIEHIEDAFYPML